MLNTTKLTLLGILLLTLNGSNPAAGAQKRAKGTREDRVFDPAVSIAENGDQYLYKGPIEVKGHPGIQKPFVPWRLEWESYPYKDFYPTIAESVWFWLHRTIDDISEADRKQITFKEGQRPGVEAREAFVIRFFNIPEEYSKDHTRKGWLRRWFVMLGARWKDYQVLRLDIELPAHTHIWWALEDRLIQPPVCGNFEIKANTPVTLELDLQEAVKARGLDLQKMWRTWVRHNLTSGIGKISNVRLSQRNTKSDYPILRDPKATLLPEHPAADEPIQPKVERNLVPLAAARTLVYSAGLPLRMGWGGAKRGGAMAIYDLDHILLCLMPERDAEKKGTGTGYGGAIEPFAVQTLDGGKTWKGLDGTSNRTGLLTATALQTEAFDSRGGLIFHTEDGCGNDPGPRHRMSVFTFAGKKGWTYNPNQYIFEEEGRQCSHYGTNWSDFVRTPSGRIWTAIRVLGREFPDWRAVNIKYSDNEGKSWHSWREGFVASIPGTNSPKGYPTPRMAVYGDYVAVIMKVNREDKQHHWTFFDGKQWAPLQEVPIPVTSVLGVGNREILVAGLGGIMRLSNGKWTSELSSTADPGTLVQSGDKILAIGTARKSDELHVYRRGADGKWSAPEVQQTGPIKEIYVPRYCPPNLAAAMYIPENDTTVVRILLVPSMEAGG